MILVAGGTGFVGSAIVRELVRRGEKVAVLTRDAARAREKFEGVAEFREGDVRDASSLARAMEGIETVVGAQQFPNSPMEDPGKGYTFEEVDAKGTERLVEAAKAAGVKRYVYLSGAGASPDAEKHWFRFKWQAEEAVRNSGMAYVILRPSWIFGPGDVSLNRFLDMSRFLPFVPMIGSPGKQKMQPVFVEDVARVAAESVNNPASANREFEIGSNEMMTMAEVVETALDVVGRKRLVVGVPKPVMRLSAVFAQFMPGRPLTPDAVDFVTEDALGDPTEVQNALGVQMTPVREAMASYLGKK